MSKARKIEIKKTGISKNVKLAFGWLKIIVF